MSFLREAPLDETLFAPFVAFRQAFGTFRTCSGQTLGRTSWNGDRPVAPS